MGQCARVRHRDSGGVVQPVVGIVMGSSSDFEVMNQAAGVLERFARRVRDPRGVRAPHARGDARVRLECEAAGSQGPDRRCGWRRSPAGHARRHDDAASDRRARRPRSSRRPRFAPLHRPNAPRRARRHGRDQRCRERRSLGAADTGDRQRLARATSSRRTARSFPPKRTPRTQIYREIKK